MSTDYADYLTISYGDDVLTEVVEVEEAKKVVPKRVLPFADSPVLYAKVTGAKCLSEGEDVKTTYDITLTVETCDHNFEPGDTIGILPCNNEDEVEQVLTRLNLLSVAAAPYKLSVLKGTAKKNPTVPAHIPVNGTLWELFLKNLDIQSPPKKLLLRALIKYTTDQEEIDLLQLMCSSKGSDDYISFIANHPTLQQVLMALKSCNPPVERLLENLPPLQPRPYSILSSPLAGKTPTQLHVAFVVVNKGDDRKGVCSGWLEKIIKYDKIEGTEHAPTVQLYFRKVNNFRLPTDPLLPIIMIAAGTGVSPFVGFLQHRQLQNAKLNTEFGPSWLFYGCRYSDKDFLYKEDIQQFIENNTLTKLTTCFSREHVTKTYIQHMIKANGREFINAIVQENAVVYVCGDAKNMAPGVKKAVLLCLMEFEGFSAKHAEAFVKHLEQTNRYVQDIWI